MNTFKLANLVEERYRRYLKTTFYFKDPDLRESFESALDSGPLSNGPFLEATPIFLRGVNPKILFPNLLNIEIDKSFLECVNKDRALYLHQETAITKSVKGSNIVVATGTGSGKTEAFLYPILLHLYNEFKNNQLGNGIRALILYPMNALANDQRERLGDICQKLKNANSSFKPTFGQYIGETPEDENDSSRNAKEHNVNRLTGELIFRSEMRKTPPHILLTNFSMLEYLLIRPDDSPLFDNGRAKWWTFLVLDEAHQYHGVHGMEMSMLLRRLKRRLREGGCVNKFRCIATSATLLGGEGDKTAVAQFASNLFDEPFSDEDIILGQYEPVKASPQKSLDSKDYEILCQITAQNDGTAFQLDDIARKINVKLEDEYSITNKIAKILSNDKRTSLLCEKLTKHPYTIKEIAKEIFPELPETNRCDTLSKLVDLLINSYLPDSQNPLLSIRYHLFLKSLEGAFISYLPKKEIFLNRHSIRDDYAAFEVALCRECGQYYLVGQIIKDQFVEANRDTSHPDFGVTFLRPYEYEISDINNDEEDENTNQQGNIVLKLCIQCGKIGSGILACNHNKTINVIKEMNPKNDDRRDQIARCSVCGYNASGRDPVQEIIYGAHGPHSVIATSLFQNLPEDRRKILAFTDGRQEAAFFAWYLEESYKDILNRNLINEVAKSFHSQGISNLSLRDLAHALENALKDKKVVPDSISQLELRQEAWERVYREFLTEEQRLSLEGVGLAYWSIQWPELFQPPVSLASSPWFLSDKEAKSLIYLLLNTMRSQKAIETKAENGISVNWNRLNLQGRQIGIRIGQNRGQTGFRSWDNKNGQRFKILAKILRHINPNLDKCDIEQYVLAALSDIWGEIIKTDAVASEENKILLFYNDSRRLNPNWWRLVYLGSNDIIFHCNTCGRLQPVSVKDICPKPQCPGKLTNISIIDLNSNHYRQLYNDRLPSTLRVEEHTAQLDSEKAREFQRDFRNGRIHVLSCSTTFELGVDLGTLDSIFLRNVPPEPFNYTQRVGRAGRRSGFPGLAITYCNRGPHDLYYFSEAEKMIRGNVKVPVLTLDNERIINRHITAVVLSKFFRQYPARFENVQNLFENLQDCSGTQSLFDFIKIHKADIEASLEAIVPIKMRVKLGLANGQWIENVVGVNSRFTIASLELSSDYCIVKELEKLSSTKRDYDKARWAQKRAETIEKEKVLNFLSREAIIPKYGFPVDVVELDTQRTIQGAEAYQVSLQRDLSIAIAEFAPTSKLIANKKVWTSYGIKAVTGKEWDRWWYKRCNIHNIFERCIYQKESDNPFINRCCNKMVITQYVDPKFGFMTNLDPVKSPTRRPDRVFTTRPYFGGFKDNEGEKINFKTIILTKVSPGYMVVLCEGKRGEGFYICQKCGAGFRELKHEHETAQGQKCNGKLDSAISLGHEFITDILKIEFTNPLPREIENIWFGYSLAYALVQGATMTLEIPPNEINATIANCSLNNEVPPPIILYDNVPGGAGLVSMLENTAVFKNFLKASQKCVSGICGCEDNTSCYGCLRNYQNQFAHRYLQRGPVKNYLETIINLNFG